MHVMIDIETFGTKPGNIIATIGAVIFDPFLPVGSHPFKGEFYERIDLTSACSAGLKFDPETIKWWLEQPHAARSEVLNGTTSLYDALCGLRDFIGAIELITPLRIWSHGAMDVVMLEAAWRCFPGWANGVPWSYRAPRDTRTLFELAGVELSDFASGTYHNALDDARNQARAVIAAYSKLGIAKPLEVVPGP